ncbi:DUF262 domain-containing protein [Roseibium aggregatum]|uniref:GmrSD restriction endonucleases N-terminal domain-containing protein n=1 Tax=Roseibium aggregatum TaxID=187304 RepID=A0A0M6Y7C8_9HYPH|nr:DUF262 domain-containing protein [Roseibium aggregatum]CTQ45309.1 hypothetical protein LAL4801_03759 [Roseibium aggregatum]
MTINAQNRSLPDWFTRIRTRQTVLPRFQRFEAWSHSTVTQMINTILQGLPVGALLVLEIGDQEPFISRTIVGAPKTGERVTEHLLDGQQRLTGLWRALHNNYEDRTYFLFLKPDEETGASCYVDSIGRWKKDGDTEHRPFWANKPKEQWKRRMIPLDLFAPGDEANTRYKTWSREAIPDADEREDISDQRADIRQNFATFNLPFLSLPVTTSKATALEVFIQMNTSAAPLKTYDIVVAQVEAGLGKSLHDLVATVKTECPNMAAYYEPEELTLYASALLQGKPPTNQTYLEKEFGQKLLEHWDELISGIKRTEIFLEEERIFDATRLPTDIVVPVLTALWSRVPNGLDKEGHARSILRKYIWRAFFSNRYEKSTNTRSLTDYLELKALLDGETKTQPVIFDSQQHPLPHNNELMLAGWPTKKERLARAILALALREGGDDLADGSTVSRFNLPKREYHHLFPDAHLTKEGREPSEIFRSLNCALITWKTNRTIAAKKPERYLAERLEGTGVDEKEIRLRIAKHIIPYDEMITGNYDAFLLKRAEMVRARMMEVCGASDKTE